MQIDNEDELRRWLDFLWASDFLFFRYEAVSLDSLHMNWKDELIKHAIAYEKNKRDFTFHHLRLMFKTLSKEQIKYPLVGTVSDYQININPGGSRLMVAKKLNLETAPLDLILHKDQLQVAPGGPCSHIRTLEQMLSPYDGLNQRAHLQLENNDGFWYQINWQEHFHWCEDDIEKWLLVNGNNEYQDKLEYYKA